MWLADPYSYAKINSLKNSEKVFRVSSVAQGALAVPFLPPYHDPARLGDSDGHISGNEEGVILEISEPKRMAWNRRVQIIHEQTKEQFRSRKIKTGVHHGHFNPLPVSTLEVTNGPCCNPAHISLAGRVRGGTHASAPNASVQSSRPHQLVREGSLQDAARDKYARLSTSPGLRMSVSVAAGLDRPR